MNLASILLAFCEINGQLYDPKSKRESDQRLRDMRQTYGLTFANKVPAFSHDYILVNGIKTNVGTILKRPLDILEPISSMNIEYHYGVVLGTSINGEEILIEMTAASNIAITTKPNFLVNRFEESQIEFEWIPIEKMDREIILDLAKELQYYSYNLLDLNCKDFAKKITTNVEPKKRSLELRKIQLMIMERGIKSLEIQFNQSNDPKEKGLILERIANLKKICNKIKLGILAEYPPSIIVPKSIKHS